jgi:SAM-dependent methyltransferase
MRGLSQGERELLLEDGPAATLPDGPLDAVELAVSETAGPIVVTVLAADTGGETHETLRRIRDPEHFSDTIEAFLESIDANATLPLGGPLFLATFTAWSLINNEISGELNQPDVGVIDSILDKPYFAQAIRHIDELIDRQAFALQQEDAEPKPAPIWFLYDIVRRLSKAAGRHDMVAALEEKWELVQYIHAKQIARVNAPTVAEAISQNFQGQDEVSILDVGARTGDALAELIRKLSLIGDIGNKKIVGKALDLSPRKPMLAEVLANHRLLGSLPAVTPIDVQGGDVMDLRYSVKENQDVILAWNILHKLKEDQHAEAIRQMAACQAPGGVLILHMPYYDDRPGKTTTGTIAKLLQRIDTGNGAIKSTSYWTKLVNANGYHVLEVRSVGIKSGGLDGFNHSVVTAIRETDDASDERSG